MSENAIPPMPFSTFMRTARPHLKLTAEQVVAARSTPRGLDALLREAEPVLRRIVSLVAERPRRHEDGQVTMKQETARDVLQGARLGFWRAAMTFDPASGPADLWLSYGAYLGAVRERNRTLSHDEDAMAEGRWLSVEDARELRVYGDDGGASVQGYAAVPDSRSDSGPTLHPDILDAFVDDEPGVAERQEKAALTLQTLVDQIEDPLVRAAGRLLFVEGRSRAYVAQALGLDEREVANAAKVARRWIRKYGERDGYIDEWHVPARARAPEDEPLRKEEQPEDAEAWRNVVPPRRWFAVPRLAFCTAHSVVNCQSCLPRVLASEIDVARATAEEMEARLGERFQVFPTYPEVPSIRGMSAKVRARRLLRRLGVLEGELEAAA